MYKYFQLVFTVFSVSALNRHDKHYDQGQWKPVEKTDPFRGPTFAYQPPLLERVRYWADTGTHKDKSDILMLGIPSKKINDGQEKFQYGQIKRNHVIPLKKHPPRYPQSPYHHVNSHSFIFPPAESVLPPSYVKENQFNYKKNPVVRFPEATNFFRPHMNTTSEMGSFKAGTKINFSDEKIETTTEENKRSTLHAVLLAERAPNAIEKPPQNQNPIRFQESFSPQMINALAIPTFESQNQEVQTTTVPSTTTFNYVNLKILPQDLSNRPPYLIIEGHSKVKTYGKDEALSKYLPKIRSISSEDPVIRHMPENSPEYQIKLVSKPKNYQNILKNSLEKFLLQR